MTDRLIDLSDQPARLRVRHEQLLIERDGYPAVSVPLNELAAVILANPQVSITQAALAGLMRCGGSIIVCDEQRLPAGLMLPINAHGTQTRRFAAQASAPRPTNKRLWQQIVRAKVRAQARLLTRLHGDDVGLGELAGRVRSGDVSNIESQAAVRYWPVLFNDPDFRRRRDADDANRVLNYGYAVLRAIVGRAICAVGLHPSLGIHHHNQYNAFCLADDLMEPFRPIVDAAAVELVLERSRDVLVDQDSKLKLFNTLADRFEWEGERRTLFDLLGIAASSLAQVYEGRAKRLVLPEV